jgi:hypothetical protein
MNNVYTFPLLYNISQKPRNLKFKGKYFLSVIGKFQFALPSGNTGHLLPQQVGVVWHSFFIFIAI